MARAQTQTTQSAVHQANYILSNHRVCLLHVTNQVSLYVYYNYLPSISFQQLCNQASYVSTVLVWDGWVRTPDKKEQMQDLS